ncbi:putative acetyltransferase [Meira miltonrushii]|uniref:Putative acetyltransferase n=1 Tax=Meira miltonrushii TaxID=1280837 RepID=A0A316VIF1_9BASI|nr:putative acetyltransferase [Meira miltonrushii]PWN35285.1 putative acetyltransferase [Meira miltonrushii]
MSKQSIDDEYILEEKVPSPEEHFNLRKQAGLTPPPRPDNETSLKNTWFGVTIRTKQNGEAVSMGRIIGDGAIFCVVVDICTLPHHQRKGLGSKIMRALVEHTDKHAPNAQLSLLADPPGKVLYNRMGFVENKLETPMVRSTFFKAYARGQREE